MCRLSTTQAAAILMLGSLSLLSACKSGNGGLLSFGVIDSEELISSFNTQVIPTTIGGEPEEEDVVPGGETDDIDITNTNEEPVFSRTGLDEILGFNRVTWAYNTGNTPEVEDLFRFTAADIVVDDELRPQINKVLDDGSGSVIVLYLQSPTGLFGVHTIARVYTNGALIIHLFETNGASAANGVFVYCFPNEDVVTCMEDMLENPDGNMLFEHSDTPIAYTEGALSNPPDVMAWMDYARSTSTEPSRPERSGSKIDANDITDLVLHLVTDRYRQ